MVNMHAKPQTLDTLDSCLTTANALYGDFPGLQAKLQTLRPYICPFEALVPHVPESSTVLDIGCGAGLFLSLLNAAGKVKEGVGIDISVKAIALAQKLPGAVDGNLDFHLTTVTDPLPEGPFDIVSMIDVAHHVPPTAQIDALSAAIDRVRPGGLFVYKDMAQKPLFHALMNRLHDLVLVREWINYLPIARVDAVADEKGLDTVHSFSINRLWYAHEGRLYRKAI